MNKALCMIVTSTFFGALLAQPVLAGVVAKTAVGTLERRWDWTIDKSADQASLILATGEQFTVNYKVKLDATYTVRNWTVSGSISAYNATERPIVITRIIDHLSDGTEVVPAPDFWWDPLPAGWTITWSYSTTGTGEAPTSNTVSVYYRFADSTDEYLLGSDTVPIAYTMTEVDKCVDASDSFMGSLGTVCVPATFTYDRQIGPYDACGRYSVDNTAAFVTNDTGATGTDGWKVDVNVPCAGGCTLTPGYWKTHSKYGPAPYDDNWAQIGEDTPYFISGQTWYQVLWTNPKGGSAYYILAHAYIAARLNLLNGAASTPQVDAALAWAEAFFGTYTPASSLSKALRQSVISIAEVLDQYNNGLIGPGHCSEGVSK